MVALVLAQASAVVGFIAWQDEDYSVETVWEYSQKDLWGDGKLTYWLRHVEPDGTVIAFENGPTSRNDTRWSYVAIDPNGSVKWRSHTNAMPSLNLGANGDYYLVDWQELADRTDTSGARWCNLTAIDGDSGYRWSFLVDNGSLDILTTDRQGTVFLQHYPYYVDMGPINEIMAVSSEGQLLWRMPHPCPNMTCRSAFIDEDGSLKMMVQDDTSSYDLIINEGGLDYRMEEREPVHKPHWLTGSEWGGMWFEVREEPVNYDVCEVSIYAFDIDTGDMVWKTLLRETVNDEHNQPNAGYAMVPTFVDRSGTIYCGDMLGERYYAIDADGNVLWSREGLISILADYRGGLLVIEDSRLIKWDPNGDTVWSKDIGNAVDLFISRAVILEDGTIYLATYDGIVAIQPTYDGQSYTPILQWVIALDVIFLTAVAAMAWRNFWR